MKLLDELLKQLIKWQFRCEKALRRPMLKFDVIYYQMKYCNIFKILNYCPARLQSSVLALADVESGQPRTGQLFVE